MRFTFEDARGLLRPDRLDYPIKWRLFRHLLKGNDPDAVRVYRWHIERRTGGVEPGSWKRTVDDYERAAGDLFRSLQANGFDPKYAIKVGDANVLLGSGAHRIAACVTLGIPIAVRRFPTEKHRRPWDRDWMIGQGMAATDLARLDRDYRRMVRGWPR